MIERQHGGVVVVVVAALLSSLLWSCASAPRGEPGPAADALAARIESAVNLPAWNDVAVVSWAFRGKNRWLWDRARGLLRLQDAQGTVLLDSWDRGGFVVAADGHDVVGAAGTARLTSAWALFINDSFWLNPFATLRDPQAQRELVDVDGATALLLRFDSGGVTPGDRYAIFVNDHGLPTRWKIWASVLAIKGFETSFADWVDVDGARLAQTHAGALDISTRPIKGGKTLQDAGVVDGDPFTRLLARRVAGVSASSTAPPPR